MVAIAPRLGNLTMSARTLLGVLDHQGRPLPSSPCRNLVEQTATNQGWLIGDRSTPSSDRPRGWIVLSTLRLQPDLLLPSSNLASGWTNFWHSHKSQLRPSRFGGGVSTLACIPLCWIGRRLLGQTLHWQREPHGETEAFSLRTFWIRPGPQGPFWLRPGRSQPLDGPTRALLALCVHLN